jgi:glutathione synthase/RimK-type ligase-like ATP-grasp enzyme
MLAYQVGHDSFKSKLSSQMDSKFSNCSPLLCQFIDKVEDALTRDPLADLLANRSLLHKDSFSERKVLMLTNDYDPEANLVGIALRNKGIDFVRLSTNDIPSRTQIRYSIGQNSDLKLEFAIRKKSLDISKISVVLLRNFDMNKIDFGTNELARTFSFQQWVSALQILQSNLKCEWISSPQATLQASDRAKQLCVAKAVGFDIPATVITNDPEAALDFYHSHDGDIVVKALHQHNVEVQGKVYSMYTRRVLNHDLSKFDDLTYAPCILQQRVLRKSELRVTVVGEQVFAAILDPQSSAGEGYDDIHRCLRRLFCMRVYDLPSTIRERCTKLIRSLGLRYGAIDFILDKNDRLVFLEVNPTGDWNYIESQLSLPITKAMVNLIEDLMK